MKHLVWILLPAMALAAGAGRVSVPLDGTWQIADSTAADPRPTAFDRTVPVPGLAHSATPAFPGIDLFESFELSNHKADRKTIPNEQRIREGRGRPGHPRNYLWYRRTFTAPPRHEAATIRIAKAQFGIAVWLNGALLGTHNGCFTASSYDAAQAIRWGASNELIVRIGAHPGMLPAGADCGQDGEKNRWTPGIYDRVSLHVANNPVIETVQAAPRLDASAVLVRTRVANRTDRPVKFRLTQKVREAGTMETQEVALGPLESREVDLTVRVPKARLWSPEDPHLYTLETGTGGDSQATRFGMREFRFDRATRRALLNGKPYTLRGSNITLHRFFEDPRSAQLPWDEKWVRRLLVEIPRQMHWNAFRFCIGPVPERWLEIADETGLLIQNEYCYWTKRPTDSVHMHFDTAGLIRNLSEFVRDNANHASVVLWDANNETIEPVFHEKVIPAVRTLDLSNRAWDNGWNQPAGPDDPVEDHLYEFNKFAREFPTVWDGMADMARRNEAFAKKAEREGRARILNEYGWNWVNRDGTPTELTKSVYSKMPGIDTPAARIEEQNYLLAGATEFWRSTRIFAGVLHFVYLTSSDPGAFTADHFRDIEKLELHEPFVRYMSQAFRPLGIYVDYWRRDHTPGQAIGIPVQVTNDLARPVAGKLRVEIRTVPGQVLAVHDGEFSADSLGTCRQEMRVAMPGQAGEYRLTATATAKGMEPSVSTRKVFVRP
jgi:hypothetical protein